jgi:hypothetical protein
MYSRITYKNICACNCIIIFLSDFLDMQLFSPWGLLPIEKFIWHVAGIFKAVFENGYPDKI